MKVRISKEELTAKLFQGHGFISRDRVEDISSSDCIEFEGIPVEEKKEEDFVERAKEAFVRCSCDEFLNRATCRHLSSPLPKQKITELDISKYLTNPAQEGIALLVSDINTIIKHINSSI